MTNQVASIPPFPQESLLVDALSEMSGDRFLCTSAGLAQFAVAAANRDQILIRKPPRLQRMSLGRIQQMDDHAAHGGWLEMTGHPSTFPPGLVENARLVGLIVIALPADRNSRAIGGNLIGGQSAAK